MNNKEIREGNKLIAEFMKLPYLGLNKYGFSGYVFDLSNHKVYPNGNILCYTNTESMEYHSSWDWLMPVVDKIESIPFNIHSITELCKVYISRNNEVGNSFPYCQIWVNEDKQFNIEDKSSKIEAVYYTIIEFIKWYNKHNKNK